MQMNGMDEPITIGKYWKQWANPRLVLRVLHNQDPAQVTSEMRGMEGDAEYDASRDIFALPAHYGQLVGRCGIRVDPPNQLGAAGEQAVRGDTDHVDMVEQGFKGELAEFPS